MARPIKATPVLSREEYYDFLKQIEKNENKKEKYSCKKIDSKTMEKIINDGPKW
jgi:hypothetical protein